MSDISFSTKEAAEDQTLPKLEQTMIHNKPKNQIILHIHEIFYKLALGDSAYKILSLFQNVMGVRPDGSVSNSLIYYFFRLASTTGEEIFALVPLLYWLYFPLATPFMTNFFFLLMTGQLVKECLMIPRPSPTDTKYPTYKFHDPHFDTEYGFPSTHTMSGILPLAVLLSCTRIGYNVSVNSFQFSYFYLISVAMSRLYLGVHSIVDICGGLLIGLFIVYGLNIWGDSFDNYILYSSTGIYAVLFSLFLYLCYYPRTKPWSANYGTSAQIYGSWFGAITATWYLIHVDQQSLKVLESSSVLSSDWSISYRILFFRLALSLLLAVIAKIVGKAIPSFIFKTLYKYEIIKPHPLELKDTLNRPVPLEKAYYVEVPVR
eukprot:gene6012-8282_t